MRPNAAVFWIALAAAFSPVLADLVRHWLAIPWSRYSLVFPFLLAARIRSEPARPAPASDGWIWIAAALALELAAAAGGVTKLGRVALPLAVWGGCRLWGLAGPATAVLVVFAVPIPHALNELASPALETGLARLTVLAGRLFGATPQLLDPPELQVGGEGLALTPADGGLSLVVLLAGLGWHAGLVLREGATASARRALAWAALGIPLQAAAIAGAAGVAAVSGAGVARALLSSAVWPAIALAGLARTRALARARRGAP
jgi:hypothetical protein